MFVFKIADLEAHQDTVNAYTTAPAHDLTSITASSIRFLGRDMIRTQSSAQPPDAPYTGVSERDAVLDGLRPELDTYLQEPRMKSSQVMDQGSGLGATHVGWCDPLRYWAVCEFPKCNMRFSAIRTDRRKEVSIPFSTRNGHPPGPSIRSCL